MTMTCKVLLLGKLLDAQAADARTPPMPVMARPAPVTAQPRARPPERPEMPDAFEFRRRAQSELPPELGMIVARATGGLPASDLR